MNDDWIEPAELFFVRVVLALSASMALPLAMDGIIDGNPVEMAFVAVTGVQFTAARLMRAEPPRALRFAAFAARLSAVVWLALLLKIESPGTVAVAWGWLAMLACFLSARQLLRFASPERTSRRDDGDDSRDPSLNGWIEEITA